MATSKAPVKKAPAKSDKPATCITAYNVREKANVDMVAKTAIIDCNVKGDRKTYIAKGVDAEGNKLAKIMSEAQALLAIKNGWAKKNWK